jgi:hypothetical protein
VNMQEIMDDKEASISIPMITPDVDVVNAQE